MFDSGWDIKFDENPAPIDSVDYRVDDIVVCKTKNNRPILRMEKDFDEKISLKIVGVKISKYSVPEYALYIPDYETGRIKPDGKISKKTIFDFNIEEKFLNDWVIMVRASQIFKHEFVADGISCGSCGDYFSMGGPNQEDGTMICYACRQNPWR